MPACTLVYPHQLFDPHPAVSKERPVALIEDALFFGDPHVGIKFHQQKIVLHRAAMKTYAARLEQRGHEVLYLDHRSGVSSEGYLEDLHERGFDCFHLCEEADYLLTRRIERFAKRGAVSIERCDSPMFLTPRDALDEEFKDRKKSSMARFYRGQRERMGILLNKDGSPRGGKWSFDDENRKALPARGLELPTEPVARATSYIREAQKRVADHYGDYFGSAESFSYPVSHSAAERWLDEFLEDRFHLFGDYEDAISKDARVLFHGVLTPMLNIGLLTPERVVERALSHAEEAKIPLNCLEGFVRQVIGWREFIHGAYLSIGVKCRKGNFWGFEDKALPDSFYDGTTGIEPVDVVIKRVLETGYCHHIERLMILGNFMLLCRFHPRRVYSWFMELFIDAYDWVMVPNVFGMSQFADGGLFTTKPYLSGSNYVRKMSNFPKGDWCPTWDGLFWSFISDHEDFFRKQHRLGMMTKQLDRMGAEKKREHLENAHAFLNRL